MDNEQVWWKLFISRVLVVNNAPIKWWQYFASIILGVYLASIIISAIIYIPGGRSILIEALMDSSPIENWSCVLITAVSMLFLFWELTRKSTVRLAKIVVFFAYCMAAATLIRTLPYSLYPVPDSIGFIATAGVGLGFLFATLPLIYYGVAYKRYSLANAALVVTLFTPAILAVATWIISRWFVIEIGTNSIQL